MDRLTRSKKSEDKKAGQFQAQDDAFFGPSSFLSATNTKRSTSARSASSSKTRNNTTAQYGNPHRSKVSGNGNGNGIGNISSAFAFTDKQKERFSSIAEKASSKISELITNNNKNNNNNNPYPVGGRSRREGEAAKVTPRAGTGAVKPRTGTSTHTSTSARRNPPGKRNDTSTTGTRIGNTQSTATRKVSANNKKQHPRQRLPSVNQKNGKPIIRRTIKNTLVGQVPLPCVYCHAIPLQYQHHPFFGPSQRICAHHDYKKMSICMSCNRFEPKRAPFHEIGTTGCLICPSCAQTAILDNMSARRIYEQVLIFFQSLGLDMFNGAMLNVPLNLVTPVEMNRIFHSFKDENSLDKYGVCCYFERHSPAAAAANLIGVASKVAAKGVKKFVKNHNRRKSSTTSNHNLQEGDSTGTSNDNNASDKIARNPFGGGRFVSITQVAALKGLPRIFLGEVLAHEATHAWLALNPVRREGVAGEKVIIGVIRQLPKLVEEGVCQLVAHLYLDNLVANSSDLSKDELLLIEYRLYSIEVHTVFEYGEGYKQAERAYNQIVRSGGSLEDLLQYISMHKAFPPS